MLLRLLTGFGKTICFQIPALVTNAVMLIIMPLVAIIRQQVKELKSFGVCIQKIIFSISCNYLLLFIIIYYLCTVTQINCIGIFNENCSRAKQPLSNVNGPMFIYTTPETFVKNVAILTSVGYITFDECHCLIEWGHDFQ